MPILTRFSIFWDDTFPDTLLIKIIVGLTTQKFPFHIFVLVYAIYLTSSYKLMSASHCFVFQKQNYFYLHKFYLPWKQYVNSYKALYKLTYYQPRSIKNCGNRIIQLPTTDFMFVLYYIHIITFYIHGV